MFTFGTAPSYSGLVSGIQSWMSSRSDIATGSTGEQLIDDWIRLTEADFNRLLRVREMESSTTSTPDSNGQFSLPSDFLELRKLVSTNTPRRDLKLINPSMNEELYGYRESDVPDMFSIEGSTVYIFPVSTTNVEVHYYATISALGWSNTSNWLLTKQPQAYLFGALKHGSIWAQDPEVIGTYTQLFNEQIAMLQRDDYGGRWARGAVRSHGQKP